MKIDAKMTNFSKNGRFLGKNQNNRKIRLFWAK